MGFKELDLLRPLVRHKAHNRPQLSFVKRGELHAGAPIGFECFFDFLANDEAYGVVGESKDHLIACLARIETGLDDDLSGDEAGSLEIQYIRSIGKMKNEIRAHVSGLVKNGQLKPLQTAGAAREAINYSSRFDREDVPYDLAAKEVRKGAGLQCKLEGLPSRNDAVNWNGVIVDVWRCDCDADAFTILGMYVKVHVDVIAGKAPQGLCRYQQ